MREGGKEEAPQVDVSRDLIQLDVQKAVSREGRQTCEGTSEEEGCAELQETMQPRSEGATLRGMRLDLGEAQLKSVFYSELLEGQLSLDP